MYPAEQMVGHQEHGAGEEPAHGEEHR
jgi:hypothetical protein